MTDGQEEHKRRWRDYRTAGGARPVKEFLDQLSINDREAVVLAMKRVEQYGLVAVRHLQREIYEVRAEGETQSFRVLFSNEGRHHQVLLSLEAFSKKTQKTPPDKIKLAEQRLRDWRERGG